MLINLLKKIGFSDKEANVYLSSLQVGPQPVSVVAKKAGINRTTTYLILNNLKKKGLASQVMKAGIIYYNVVSPQSLLGYVDRLEHDLDRDKKELEKMIPSFMHLVNPASSAPKIKFYEGIEGIIHVYEDTLKEPTKEIYSFWGTEGMPKAVMDYLDKDYIPHRVRLNIPFLGIVPDAKMGKEMKKSAKEFKREILLIPLKRYPFQIEINIYADKVAFLSYKEEESVGVIIESEAIHSTMKMIHKVIWNSYKE